MNESILPYDILRFDYKERLPDRFLATHLHRFEMFSKPVAIAILIEIVNPWHPASQFGQKIINGLVREFAQRQAQSYLARFEGSLHEVNRDIQDALEKTQSEISCLAVLLESDQIHCAGIGSAKLGLLRSGKISTILGSNQTSSATFTAVTSGDLHEGDWLLLANSGFYSTLTSLDPSLWTTSDIGTIAEQIKLAKNRRLAARPAGILLRYNQVESTADQTTFWESDHVSPSGRSSRVLTKLPSKTAILTGITAVVARLGSYLSRLGQLLGGLFGRLSRKRAADNIGERTGSPVGRWTDQLRRFLPLLIGLIVIVSIFGLTIQRRQNARTNSEPPSSLLTTVQSSSADQFLSTLATQFSPDAYGSLSLEDKAALLALLKEKKAEIIELTDPLFEATSPVVSLAQLNHQLILVNEQGGLAYWDGTSLVGAGTIEPTTTPSGLAVFSEKNIVVSDQAGNLWQFSDLTNPPSALTIPSGLAAGAKIVGSYQGNLYFLNQSTKTTFRAVNFSGSLSNLITYNPPENLKTLSEPADLAINGKLIVVDSQGQVAEYARNSPVTPRFKIPAVTGPIKITLDEAGSTVIVGSGQSIYVVRDNQIVSTLILNITDNISDILVDESSPNQLYLAVQTKVYKLSLAASL